MLWRQASWKQPFGHSQPLAYMRCKDAQLIHINQLHSTAARQRQAMFEVRLQQKHANWWANTTCWFLLHIHADHLHPMTFFVSAVHKDMMHQIYRPSVSSIAVQHAVLYSVQVASKMLHDIPVLLVCHISLRPAAYLPADKVLSFGADRAGCRFMLTACAMHWYDLSLLPAGSVACFDLSQCAPCILSIVKCCNIMTSMTSWTAASISIMSCTAYQCS